MENNQQKIEENAAKCVAHLTAVMHTYKTSLLHLYSVSGHGGRFSANLGQFHREQMLLIINEFFDNEASGELSLPFHFAPKSLLSPNHAHVWDVQAQAQRRATVRAHVPVRGEMANLAKAGTSNGKAKTDKGSAKKEIEPAANSSTLVSNKMVKKAQTDMATTSANSGAASGSTVSLPSTSTGRIHKARPKKAAKKAPSKGVTLKSPSGGTGNLMKARCTWSGCTYQSRFPANVLMHIRSVHFKLPQSKTKQEQLGIVDGRDPHDYLEKL